jgi:hypothetical protein
MRSMSRPAFFSRRRAPLYLEFTLAHLIARCDGDESDPERRLDAMESSIALLARTWRDERPIAPARELRMSDDTREALLGWVEARQAAQGSTLSRLAVYASGAVTDAAVPDGWLRLRLGPGAFGLSLHP